MSAAQRKCVGAPIRAVGFSAATASLRDNSCVKLSRGWRLGGVIYTMVVVVSVVLRLWRPSGLSSQVASAITTFSDFSTLPPFFAGIGLYPGLLTADVLQQLTGL